MELICGILKDKLKWERGCPHSYFNDFPEFFCDFFGTHSFYCGNWIQIFIHS